MAEEDSEAHRAETEEILQLLGGEEELVEIPELSVRVRARGDLAAFWDGYRAGRDGLPIPRHLSYDNTGIYRRAHIAGTNFRNSLT